MAGSPALLRNPFPTGLLFLKVKIVVGVPELQEAVCPIAVPLEIIQDKGWAAPSLVSTWLQAPLQSGLYSGLTQKTSNLSLFHSPASSQGELPAEAQAQGPKTVWGSAARVPLRSLRRRRLLPAGCCLSAAPAASGRRSAA